MRIAKLIGAASGTPADLLRSGFVVPPAYDFAANGAVDVSTPEAVEIFRDARYLDFKQYREAVKVAYQDGGSNWAVQSIARKTTLARLWLVGVSQRDEIFDANQQKLHWQEVIREYRAVRNDRVLLGVAEVTTLMPLLSYMDFGLSTEILIDRFIKFDLPDLLYFIENTPGTAYATAGFAQKAYFSTTVRDRLVNRIKWNL